MTIPVKPISELEEKSTVSASDKILILDSVSEEARLAPKSELKWDKGDTWDKGDKGDKWDKWDKGDTWATWATWPQGATWAKGAKWDKWDKWDQGLQGSPWADWNWIASITSSKEWKTTTVVILETNWQSETFQIQDGKDWNTWAGSWDVVWPNSVVSSDIVLFDGTSGKMIKDSWHSLSEYQTKANLKTNLTDNSDSYYPSQKAVKTAVDNKQDKLTTQTAYTSKGSATKVAQITTNTLWQVTGITEVDISFPTQEQADWSEADNTKADYIKNKPTLWTAAAVNTWTTSGTVPVLDANWKLATSTLPWVALTDTFTVSTSSDLTSLSSADQWDIAIVTSENKTYVLSQAPYSTAANWKEILAPTGWVTSFNWQTWAVTYTAPVTSVNSNTWAVTVSEFSPSNAWTTGNVLTKTAWGYEWAAPSGWDVVVSSDSDNVLTTWAGLWAWDEADLPANPSANTLYFVF